MSLSLNILLNWLWMKLNLLCFKSYISLVEVNTKSFHFGGWKYWPDNNTTNSYSNKKNGNLPGVAPYIILSILCKVIDWIKRDQIMKYMVNNGLFNDCQDCFTPNRSCVTQLNAMMEARTEILDHLENINSIYADLQRFFTNVYEGGICTLVRPQLEYTQKRFCNITVVLVVV